MFLFLLTFSLFVVHVSGTGESSGLLRFNLQTGSETSADLGSYKFFDCSGGAGSSSSRSCSFISSTESDSPLMEYLSGTAVYSCLNIIGFCLFIVVALVYVVYLMVRCCLVSCGSSKAPKKTRHMHRPCAAVFGFSLLSLLSLILFSTFAGNDAITENLSSEQYGFDNSVAGVQRIIHGLEPYFTQTALSTTSDVLAPLISQLNATVNEAISLPDLIAASESLNTTLHDLPSPSGLVDILTDIQDIAYNSSDIVDDLINDLEGLDDTVGTVSGDLSALTQSIVNLTATNDVLLVTIHAVNDSLVDLDNFLDYTVGSGGVISSSRDDLKAMQRVQNGGMLPNEEVFVSATTGYGSTARLIDGSMNSNVTDITLMNSKLTDIYTNLSGLPSYSLSADNLVAVNDTISAALAPYGLLENMTDAITQLSVDVLLPLPHLYTISDVLSTFESRLIDMSDQIGESIDSVNRLLDTVALLLPQFTRLNTTIMGAYEVENVLPVVETVREQLVGVNTTILILSGQLLDIYNATGDVNQTITDFLYNNGTLDDILDGIVDGNATVIEALDDSAEYVANLTDFKITLDDSIVDYNISDLNATVMDAIDLLIDIDFNDTFNEIKRFEDALLNVTINSTLVNDLIVLQSYLDTLLSLLGKAVSPSDGDYVRLAEGYCAGDVSMYCAEDSNCTGGGGVCQAGSKGTYRCATPIGNIACTSDATCTAIDATSYCLADSDRATVLHSSLDYFSDSSRDIDSAAILEELNSALDTGDISLVEADQFLEDGMAALTVFNTSETLDLISEVQESIDEVNITETIDILADLQDDIIENVDNDNIDLLKDFEDPYDSIVDDIENFIETMKTFKRFLFDSDTLNLYLSNVKKVNLLRLLGLHGPSYALNYVGSQVDAALHFLATNQSEIDIDRNSDFGSRYEDNWVYLDRAGASRYPTSSFQNDLHGPLYYMFGLFNFTVDGMDIIRYDDPKALGVTVNSDGYQYEEGGDRAYCLTTECFSYTQGTFSTVPMGEVMDEVNPPKLNDTTVTTDDDNSYSYMSMTREEIMLYLWAPIVFLLLFGTFTLILGFYPDGWTGFCQKSCNCFFLTCGCFQLPIILMSTAIFFLFIMVTDDLCHSGSNMGSTYLTEFGDEYCSQTLGGTGTLDACKMNFSLPESSFGENENITLSVNVLDMYSGLFQNDCSAPVDPFANVLQQLADQVKELPMKAKVVALDDADMDFRPQVVSIFNNTAENVGTLLYELTENAQTVVDCETVTLVYENFSDSLCGSMVGPLFWWIGCWYLCGWVLCCCALPASMSTLIHEKKVEEEDAESVHTDEVEAALEEDQEDQESHNSDDEAAAAAGEGYQEVPTATAIGGDIGGRTMEMVITQSGSRTDKYKALGGAEAML